MIIIPLIENATRLTELASQDQQLHVLIADNLKNGGTTVSKGVMAESIRYAHEHGASIDFLIAPRTGSAHYSDIEIKMMETDILEAQQLGADGVVFAALNDSGLDTDGLDNLIAAAGGMTLSFSTAFDQLSATQQPSALKWLADAGFDRVLTTVPETVTALGQTAGLQLVPVSDSPSTTKVLAAQAAPAYLIEIQA